MKTIESYKARYRKAIMERTKGKILNSAYLNLSYSDFQIFLKWQLEWGRNHF